MHFITILTSYLNDEKKTPKQKQKSTKKNQNKTNPPPKEKQTKKTKKKQNKTKKKQNKKKHNNTKFPSYITCHLISKVITSLKFVLFIFFVDSVRVL